MARKPYFHEDELPEDERELRRQFLTSLGVDPDTGWKYDDLNDWENMRDLCEVARRHVSDEHLNAQMKWWYAERERLKVKHKQAVIDRVKQAAETGAAVDLSPNDIAEAKLYARARSFALMQKAFDTLEEIIGDADAKPNERTKAAEVIIARAIGPAELPNSIPFPVDLSQLSPTETINVLAEGVVSGACSESFAKTLVTLLGAKIQGQKLEEMVAARARTINAIPVKTGAQHLASNSAVDAPNGNAPVASNTIPPAWAFTLTTQPN